MALFKSKKITELEQQVKALQQMNFNQFSSYITDQIKQSFNSINYYPDWSAQEVTNQYITSDHVYSVVNKIAEDSATHIPVYVYLKKQDQIKSLRKLEQISKAQFFTSRSMFDMKVLQVKALEDVPDEDPLNQLLEKPNPYQSKTEFLTAAYSYYLLNGECFILILAYPEGGDEGQPYAMYVLPPANVTMRVTNTFPQEITGYDFMMNGRTVLTNIPPQFVIHWKRFNPNMDLAGSHLRGLSPLKPGGVVINRLSEADNRSISQLKNGAVPGIVYDETFNGEEVEQSQFDAQKKAFYDFSKDAKNAGAPFFVGTKKGYLQTGLSAADMKIPELQGIDFERLCNIYKISTILFNSNKASTESNVQEQIKSAYTSAYLPMVFSFINKLNSSLAPLYKEPYYIDTDISAIPELQDDIKLMLQALSYMPVCISGDEQRLLLNYDETGLPWMKEPLIKQGYQFYEDMTIPPVDPNLLNTGPDDKPTD